MSWLFSLALVEEYSAATCSDGERSAPSKSTHTQRAYLSPDRTTAFSRPSRFGMTFEHLMDDLGEAVLTWCLEASHARTYRQPEKELESMARAPGCGGRWRELSVRYDRDSCSWKTHRSLFEEDLPACSLILPKWGSMLDGELSELLTLERRTSGTGYGLWPTPTSTLGTNGGRVTPSKAREGGTLIEALSARTTWPTPTVCGNYDRKGASAKSGDGLATAVARWRTPNTVDAKGGTRRPGTNSQVQLAHQVGGSLNPTWVEWLMGWPLGWTGLNPLAMVKFHEWQFRHGGCCPDMRAGGVAFFRSIIVRVRKRRIFQKRA